VGLRKRGFDLGRGDLPQSPRQIWIFGGPAGGGDPAVLQVRPAHAGGQVPRDGGVQDRRGGHPRGLGVRPEGHVADQARHTRVPGEVCGGTPPGIDRERVCVRVPTGTQSVVSTAQFTAVKYSMGIRTADENLDSPTQLASSILQDGE